MARKDRGIQPTYEELKRELNRKLLFHPVRIQPTYEELKLFATSMLMLGI